MPYKIIASVTIEAKQRLRRQDGVAGWPSRQVPCLPLPAGTPKERHFNIDHIVKPTCYLRCILAQQVLAWTPYEGFLDQFFITEVANITVLSLTVTFHNDKIVVSPLFSLKTRKMNKNKRANLLFTFALWRNLTG